jgi:hypothetical protein
MLTYADVSSRLTHAEHEVGLAGGNDVAARRCSPHTLRACRYSIYLLYWCKNTNLTQKTLQLFKQQSSIEPIDSGVVGGRCSNFDAVASFNEGQGLMNVWVNQKSFAFEPTGEGRRYTHKKMLASLVLHQYKSTNTDAVEVASQLYSTQRRDLYSYLRLCLVRGRLLIGCASVLSEAV